MRRRLKRTHRVEICISLSKDPLTFIRLQSACALECVALLETVKAVDDGETSELLSVEMLVGREDEPLAAVKEAINDYAGYDILLLSLTNPLLCSCLRLQAQPFRCRRRG